MSYCKDCKTKMSNKMCSNCQELYILETQYKDINFPLSDEFTEKIYEKDF